eukprot:365848-Chlamydomonas_euryale.AAC.3
MEVETRGHGGVLRFSHMRLTALCDTAEAVRRPPNAPGGTSRRPSQLSERASWDQQKAQSAK